MRLWAAAGAIECGRLWSSCWRRWHRETCRTSRTWRGSLPCIPPSCNGQRSSYRRQPEDASPMRRVTRLREEEWCDCVRLVHLQGHCPMNCRSTRNASMSTQSQDGSRTTASSMLDVPDGLVSSSCWEPGQWNEQWHGNSIGVFSFPSCGSWSFDHTCRHRPCTCCTWLWQLADVQRDVSSASYTSVGNRPGVPCRGLRRPTKLTCCRTTWRPTHHLKLRQTALMCHDPSSPSLDHQWKWRARSASWLCLSRRCLWWACAWSMARLWRNDRSTSGVRCSSCNYQNIL